MTSGGAQSGDNKEAKSGRRDKDFAGKRKWANRKTEGDQFERVRGIWAAGETT